VGITYTQSRRVPSYFIQESGAYYNQSVSGGSSPQGFISLGVGRTLPYFYHKLY